MDAINSSVSIWSVVTGVLAIVQFLGMIVIFCIVKFNDLAHLESKMTKISEKQDGLEKQITTISGGLEKQISAVSKDVSYLMGVNKGKELKTKKA